MPLSVQRDCLWYADVYRIDINNRRLRHIARLHSRPRALPQCADVWVLVGLQDQLHERHGLRCWELLCVGNLQANDHRWEFLLWQ
jgi:hypothetical protein